MSGNYPRVGHWEKLRSTTNKECRHCGARAAIYVVVQHSWFRGDDEHLNLCDGGAGLLQKRL